MTVAAADAATAVMGVTVLFFARGRELAGQSEISVQLTDAPDTARLWAHLLKLQPGLSEIMKTSVLSLNQEYLVPTQNVNLKEGDEVAVIPPVSGG